MTKLRRLAMNVLLSASPIAFLILETAPRTRF
jgi:hypothetical protein